MTVRTSVAQGGGAGLVFSGSEGTCCVRWLCPAFCCPSALSLSLGLGDRASLGKGEARWGQAVGLCLGAGQRASGTHHAAGRWCAGAACMAQQMG